MRCDKPECGLPACRGSWINPNDPSKPRLVLCLPHGREKESDGYQRVGWR